MVRRGVCLLLVRRPEHALQARDVRVEGLRVPPLLVQHRLAWVVGAALEDIGDAALILSASRPRQAGHHLPELVLPSGLHRALVRPPVLARQGGAALLDRIGEDVIVTEARVLGLNLASEVDGPVCLVAGRCGPPQLTS